ncbi:hypothetical protein P8452_75035 [Trifolium repens]|nr:hypothetical protein P8452_75035 [Trifolium repens]
MSPSFYTLPLFFLFFTFPCNSIHFQFSRFIASDPNIIYQGSAAPIDGKVDFNINKEYNCQVGRAIYAKRVLLWDFTTHFTFIIDTPTNKDDIPGDGFAFFLGPFGIDIPPNSSGSFLGLFNLTTMNSTDNHIVHVEFDSFSNYDRGERGQHVEINENSIFSSIVTPWNAKLHSKDTADVWISYNSTTTNLTASWKYQNTYNPQEKTSLSYQIDLMKVLPEWVTVGFSASTGAIGEKHILLSWEFSSTSDQSYDDNDDTKKIRLVVIVTVSCGIVALGALTIFALLWMKRKRSRKQKEEAMHLRSMNHDLEGGAGPRNFTYEELDFATHNFSSDRKLGQGGFGAVYKGYFFDIDLSVAVKKISRGSRQEWERCVVHRDIKSSNIMLDSSFNVKLGDFGLAKLMDHEIGPQTTVVAGTLGYMAPEYISTGKARKESDVYSFGVVALEITTGRKVVEVMSDKDGEKGMIEWVWDHYGRGELLKAMDDNLKNDYDEKQVECLMIVGLWCAHPDVNLRPSIRQAIQVLNFEAGLPNLPPKKPVATYHAPPPVVSSVGVSITTSLQDGR